MAKEYLTFEDILELNANKRVKQAVTRNREPSVAGMMAYGCLAVSAGSAIMLVCEIYDLAREYHHIERDRVAARENLRIQKITREHPSREELRRLEGTLNAPRSYQQERQEKPSYLQVQRMPKDFLYKQKMKGGHI